MAQPIKLRPWMTTQEVAQYLGITDALLLRRLRHLQEEEAFPLEAPHQRRPKLFRRVAVERWLHATASLTADEIEAAECLGHTKAQAIVQVLAARS